MSNCLNLPFVSGKVLEAGVLPVRNKGQTDFCAQVPTGSFSVSIPNSEDNARQEDLLQVAYVSLDP